MVCQFKNSIKDMTFLFTILHLFVYFTWAFLCLLEHCPPSLLFPFTITLFSLSLLRKTIFYRRNYFVFVMQKIFGKTSFLICIVCLSHPKKKNIIITLPFSLLWIRWGIATIQQQPQLLKTQTLTHYNHTAFQLIE